MENLAQSLTSENVYLIEYIKVIWNSKKKMKTVRKNINH